MNRMRNLVLAAVSVLALGTVAGCSSPAPETTPSEVAPSSNEATTDLLAAHGLSGMSAREVIETLDQEPAARPLPLMGSVTYDEVVLSDGTSEVSLPLDGDEFYISVAPYENRTHDCYFHSLGTCQGELANSAVHVTVVSDDGETLIDEDRTTYANGFVGLWVPKDITGTVSVTREGKTAEMPFSSDDEGATCLTTLKLS